MTQSIAVMSSLQPGALIMLAALTIDALTGDPDWLYRRVPHPVVVLGALVNRAEKWLWREGAVARNVLAGSIATVAVIALALVAGFALDAVLETVPFAWVGEAVLASTLIAFRGLHDHVLAVARALDHGLSEGRVAVAEIVGRDPQRLDRAGVARAAIESLAENFSDGVVAPLFWFALLGLPGLLAYKAVNTLDSMIGHRSPRYLYFGKCAARLDDVVNFVPARIAGLLFVLSALPASGGSVRGAYRTMVSFAPLHRSPNAGWQEAAVAGALGFALAGPRQYGDERVEDAWMGDGRSDLSAADIRASLHLYRLAGMWLAGGLALAWAAGL